VFENFWSEYESTIFSKKDMRKLQDSKA